MRKVVMLVLGLAGMLAAFALSGGGGAVTGVLPVSVVSESASSFTVGWTAPAGIAGYEFKVDGARVSSTWDASRSTVRFSKVAGAATHTYEVVAVAEAQAGSVTFPVPPPTTTTTTTTPAAQTFEQATAYSRTQLPFTALRTITVTSQQQLQAAVTNLQPGDLVRAGSPFSVTGEFVISKKLAAPAVLDLGGISFNYGGTLNLTSVWIHDAANLRLYGGDITNPTGGPGITVYASSSVLWWGFHVHDTGGTGLAMFPIGGAIDHDDFAGEISGWGRVLTWDPHAEKGTGIHGAIMADAATPYAFSSNQFALDVHDGPSGAGVEIGDDDGSPITGNILYLRARNLTMVAKQQVAANALQLWGSSSIGLTVNYLEASNLQGRAVDTNGVNSSATMSGVVIQYGLAQNTNLNPLLSSTESAISPSQPWDPRHAVTYADVQPKP